MLKVEMNRLKCTLNLNSAELVRQNSKKIDENIELISSENSRFYEC